MEGGHVPLDTACYNLNLNKTLKRLSAVRELED